MRNCAGLVVVLLACMGCGDDGAASAPADAAPVPDAIVSDAAIPDAPIGLRIFVSSEVFSGDNVALADEHCERLAAAASFSGEWVSWTSTQEESAGSKLSASGPWLRVDGRVLFSDLASMEKGPANPINQDENGALVSDSLIYTGTLADGQASGADCSDWTSYYPEGESTVGWTNAVDGEWSNREIINCARPRRIYCVQNSL